MDAAELSQRITKAHVQLNADGPDSGERGWELRRPAGVLLHDDGAGSHPITMAYIANFEFDQIASTQLG